MGGRAERDRDERPVPAPRRNRDRGEPAGPSLFQDPGELQRLLDFLPHRVFVKDAEGRFLLANRAAADVFGLPVGQVLGRRHEDLPGDPAEIARLRRADQQVLRTRRSLVVPAEEHTDGLGRRRVFRTVKVPFPLHGGRTRAVLGLSEDITEEHRLARWLEAVFEQAPCGMVVTDDQGRIVMVNRELEELTGHDRNDLIGCHVSVLVPGELRAKHAEARRTLLADHDGDELVIRGRDAHALRADGSTFPVEVGMNPVELPEGTYILSTVVDVTERKHAEARVQRLTAEMEERVRLRTARLRAANARLRREVRQRRRAEQELKRAQKSLSATNQELQRLAMRDPLTGLHNRRYLDQCLEHEWRRARRNGRCLSLVVADIDHFKAFNDARGHLEGDRCLVRVAEAIGGCVRRPADVTARYGGEEFAILLPETGLRGARQVAERMRQAVESLGMEHPAGGPVTLSLGVAAAARDPEDSHRLLLARADAALYRAKREGRNRVAV